MRIKYECCHSCRGFGTRISEESYLKPKSILWHIMKEYFANYYLYHSDITFDFTNKNQITTHNNAAEPWKVTVVDTGLDTLTNGWINGGFMVIEPKVIDYIEGDSTTFEREPLENLSKDGQLCAYQHYGFWQCMDTMRDKQQLEELLQSGKAPWKVWED